MGLVDDIAKVLHNQLDCHVAWLPISNSFQLGDFGLIANGVFNKMGDVSELGLTFESEESPASSLNFVSADTRIATFQGNVAVDVIPEGAIDGKVKLSFSREGSLLLKAKNVRVQSLKGLAALMKALDRKPAWRRSYKVVAKTWSVERAAILSTRGSATEVTVAGDAPALERFKLGDVSADLRLGSNQEMGLQLVGAKGVIGLGLAKLTWLGGVDTLGPGDGAHDILPTGGQRLPDDPMTDDTLQVFSEVHVVSDLHLGGGQGFQIFDQGPRLAALIDHLAARPAAPLALVLNGDIVDFLAEDNAVYLDQGGAVSKLQRIVQDAGFAPVWMALRRFVARAGRVLVLVLGNHDVELALPAVRTWLTGWLAGDSEAARGRIVWAVDGSGFPCRVGSRRVLCVHGNEVDDWNVVDHRALLQVIRAQNRQTDAPNWTPNAGTRLVIDVMNKIKRQHPMVDLLKPETKAAIPILLALNPAVARDLGRALRAVTRKVWDGLRMTAGFLGGDDVDEAERPSEVEALRAMLGTGREPATDDLRARILAAQRRIERNETTRTIGAGDGDFLGWGDWLSETKRPEELRKALAGWLAKDDTFDPAAPDGAFEALDEVVSAGIHYLISGHTHLRRALRRKYPGAYYYNTGTWIRLIELKPDVLSDAKVFARIFTLLQAGRLNDLDEAQVPDGKDGQVGLVVRLPTVASIISDAARVYGVLQDVQADGTPIPLPNTLFEGT